MSVRRRSRNRSGLKAVLLLAAGGLILAGGAYLVWFSDLFKVQTVSVTSEESITAGDLNLTAGGNILFWRPVVDLGAFPQIAGFKIEKNYFERAVTIRLGSREKYAIWCLEDKGECLWADDTGIAFSRAPDFQGPLLFRLIRDYSDRTLAIGDQVLDKELFSNLKAAFDFLAAIEVEVQEFRIEDLKFKEAVAKLESGPDIYFSLTLDPHFGLGVVRSLRQSGEWDIIQYLDLRVPNRAYYSG